MTRRARLCRCTRTILSLSLVVALASASGARSPAKAEPISERTLKTPDGKSIGFPLAKAPHVLVFFRADQPHSEPSLVALAAVEAELSERPVRWAALVSERYDAKAAAELAKRAGLRMPVAVDAEGDLHRIGGVVAHPTVVLLDATATVVARQPFTQVNFGPRVTARIRHLLGELDDEGLEKALRPPADRTPTGDKAAARRFLSLGKMLLKVKRYEKAEEAARSAVAHDATLADAHWLLGAVLAARGDCPSAAKCFARALELDPEHAEAKAGAEGCAK